MKLRLTLDRETDALADGGRHSVGSNAQVGGHVVTADFTQVQMSPLPFGYYVQTNQSKWLNMW